MSDEQVSETVTPDDRKPVPISIRMVGEMAPLFAAKAKARLGFRAITKNRHVTVTTAKGPYEYDYATLDEVRDACDRAFAEQGIDIFYVPCDALNGDRELHTFLTHSSGAFIEAVVVLPREKMTDSGPKALTIQETGSSLTYWERYSYVALAGVAAEHDDDGNAADGKTVAIDPRKPKTAAPAQAAPKGPPPLPKQPETKLGPKPEPRPSETRSDTIIDEPCPQELSKEIATQLKELDIRGNDAVELCRKVTGKEPRSVTKLDGERFLERLKELRVERAVH